MTPLPEGIILTPQGIHVLERDSHLSRWIEQSGRLDIAEGEIAHFAGYIPKGGTVIDAGACLGDHSATYAKLVGSTGTVLAFEPGWLTYQALYRNFDGIPQVKCHHAALGRAAGRSCHNLAENAGGSHLSNDGQDNVDVVAIDDLRLGRLDFCHFDCEGFEPLVLQGGRETFLRLRPVMVIEINKGALARFGFKDEDVYRALDDMRYGWGELWETHNRDMEQRDIIAFPK